MANPMSMIMFCGIINRKVTRDSFNKVGSLGSNFNRQPSDSSVTFLPRGLFVTFAKLFGKTNIYLLIRTRTCAYKGVRDVDFSENFTNVIN